MNSGGLFTSCFQFIPIAFFAVNQIIDWEGFDSWSVKEMEEPK